MNEANLIQRFNDIVTGDRFLREVELSLHGHVRASDDYNPLVNADVPTWVENGIQFDDGETAFLDFNIPMDYDEGVDICALRLHEIPQDATAATDLGITTAQSIFRAGAAVNAAVSTAVAEASTASTGIAVRENVLDISGRGYKPGDHIRLTLDANNAGATEIILLGIDLIYSGDVAAYNDDDRFRDLG